MATKILGNQIASYTINTEQLSNTATTAFAKTLAPKILYANVTSNTYSVLDDTAVNVGGGFIVVTGSEFQSGATVLVDTTQASAVTYINSTTLRAQVPAKSAASYNLYVVNPDGGTGLKVAGVTYSSEPSWVTSSTLVNVVSNTAFTGSFNATSATSYANTTILPTGFNLLANGYYFGNISVGATTSYNFNIRATDAELQESTKTFSLTAIDGIITEYLVVAGGGGGAGGRGTGASGQGGGGGGAGGLLAGTLVLAKGGQSYTITVGTGGGGGAGGATGSPGGQGTPSAITNPSPLFTNVSVTGGGFGGGASTGVAGNGGSGGGSNGGGTLGTGISGQGYPGAAGAASGNPSFTNGAGGGGAGGAGLTPGTAGPGYTWPITGITYAVGGGGATSGGSTPGTTSPTYGSGGGGGAGRTGVPSGALGGVSAIGGAVILAIPTPQYPGSAPGATVSTPPAAPGKTVLTFTGPGTYTT
jgi:hypothetical protein